MKFARSLVTIVVIVLGITLWYFSKSLFLEDPPTSSGLVTAPTVPAKVLDPEPVDLTTHEDLLELSDQPTDEEIAAFRLFGRKLIAIGDGTAQVFARRFVSGTWSAAQPRVFSAGSVNGGLTIETLESTVRIVNNGERPIDLEYFRVQGAVRYKFDYGRSPVLAPGEQLTLTPLDYLGLLDGARPVSLVGPRFEFIDSSVG